MPRTHFKIPDKEFFEEWYKPIRAGEKTQREAAAHYQVSEAAISKRMHKLDAIHNISESLKDLSDAERSFVMGKVGGLSNTEAAMRSRY